MDSATATGSGQVRLQPRREDQRCRSKFVLVPVLVLQDLNGDEGETEREIIPLQSGDNVVETRPPAAITIGGGAAGWDSSVAGTNPQVRVSCPTAGCCFALHPRSFQTQQNSSSIAALDKCASTSAPAAALFLPRDLKIQSLSAETLVYVVQTSLVLLFRAPVL